MFKKLLSYYYHFEPSSEESEIRQVVAEVPGSSFFNSDSGSETVQSKNSVPIPRLSMAKTRFRVRFRDCTGFELDSGSGSATEQG